MILSSKTQSPKAQEDCFLEIVTEFYCGLTSKKDMHNISTSIRYFVMNRQDCTNKYSLAKRLLDYFLQMYLKIEVKNETNWDKIFYITTARGRALLRICNFPQIKDLRLGFNSIKNIYRFPTMAASDFGSILYSTKTIQNTYEFDNIYIEEDVRIKTYYFFKWCQYLEQVRLVKELKMREVYNQKISMNFHKNGMKFNYFNAWKKVYKKHKTERERIKAIEKMSRERILRKNLEIIQEVSAFEGYLATKVSEKIIEGQKRNLYKKLKNNSDNVKILTSQKIKPNEFYHIFLKNCIKDLKPLMNKSYQSSRIRFYKYFEKLTLGKIFSSFKIISGYNKYKLKKTVETRKKIYLLNWRSRYLSKNSFQKKNNEFISFLSSRRSRIALTILHFNKLAQLQYFENVEDFMRENYNIYKCGISYIGSQKFIAQKRNLLSNHLLLGKKQQFFAKLAKYHEECEYNEILSIKSKRLHFKTLFSRELSYCNKRKYKDTLYKKMDEFYLSSLMAHSFKNWKKLKAYHKFYEKKMNSIANCGEKIVMLVFWNRFKFRLEYKYCVYKLSEAVQQCLLRIAYTKIVGRSKIINEKVSLMKNKKNVSMMRKLWTLLKINQSYNENLAQKINEFYTKRCYQNLIVKLRKLYLFNLQQRKTSEFLYSKYKEQFIEKFKKDFISRTYISEKSEIVAKKVFLQYFYRSVKSGIEIYENNEQKIEYLENRLMELSATKILLRLKENYSYKTELNNKKYYIYYYNLNRNVLKVKQCCEKVQFYKILAYKYEKIRSLRVSNCIKILSLQYKTKIIQYNVNFGKVSFAIKDFIEICQYNKEINCQINILKYKMNSKLKSYFYGHLEDDMNYTKVKIQKFYEFKKYFFSYFRNNIKKDMLDLINLLRNNKENIENVKTLCLNQKQAAFSYFLAMNLRDKFCRIKFNCSLKFYAKNLLKKGLKSFKQNHIKLKQKYNIIRHERTSSILVYKSIEKSFKSNSLSEQIYRFNLRRSRQVR